MADLIVVQRWLLQLGRAVAIRASSDDADDFVETMAPMLAYRFPNEAFSFDAFEHVAAQSKFLPNYGELVERLGAHWQQHRERRRVLALPPPRAESREPYKLPPPPPERKPRHLGPLSRDEISQLVQKPLRSVAQQLAELGFAEGTPLKVAATPIRAETKRGPPLDA